MVHRYWDLDEPCLDAMRHWDRWEQVHDGPGDYGDVAESPQATA